MLLVLSLLFGLGGSNYTGIYFELLRISIPPQIGSPLLVCTDITAVFGNPLVYECYGQLDQFGNTTMSIYITDNQAVLPMPSSNLEWNITTVNNTYSNFFDFANQFNSVSQLQYNITGLGQNVTFVYVLLLDQAGCSTVGSSTSESTTLSSNATTTVQSTTISTVVSTGTTPSNNSLNLTVSSSTAESTTLGYNGTTTQLTTAPSTSAFNTTLATTAYSTIASTSFPTPTTTVLQSTTAVGTTLTSSPTPTTTVLQNTTAVGTTLTSSPTPTTTVRQNTTAMGTTTYTSATSTLPSTIYTTTSIVIKGTTIPTATTPYITQTIQPSTTISKMSTSLPTTTVIPVRNVTTSTPSTTYTTTSVPISTSTTVSSTVSVSNSTARSNLTTTFPSTIMAYSSTTEQWTETPGTSATDFTTTEPTTTSSTTLSSARTTHRGFNHTTPPARKTTSTSSTFISTTTTTTTTTTTLPTTTPLDCTMCPVGCLSLVVVNPATRMVTAPPELFYIEEKKSYTGMLIFAIVEATFIVLLLAVLLLLRFTPLGRRYLHLLTGEDRREVRREIEERADRRGGDRKDEFQATVSASSGYEIPRSVLNKAGRLNEELKSVQNNYAVPIQHNKKRAPQPPSNPPPPIPPFRRENSISEIERGDGDSRKYSEQVQRSSDDSASNELPEHEDVLVKTSEEETEKAKSADTYVPVLPTKETVHNITKSQDNDFPHEGYSFLEASPKLNEVHNRDSIRKKDFTAISMEEDFAVVVDPRVGQSLPTAPSLPVPDEESRPSSLDDPLKTKREDSVGKEKANEPLLSSPRDPSALTPPEDGVDYYSDWVNWIKKHSPYVVSWTLGFDPVFSRNVGTGTEETENDKDSTVANQDPSDCVEPIEVSTFPASRRLSWPVDQKKEADSSANLFKEKTPKENSYEEIPYGSESDIIESLPPPLPQSPPPPRRVPDLIDFYESGRLRRPDDLYTHHIKPKAPQSHSISFSIGNTEVILVSPSDALSKQDETSSVVLSELIDVEEDEGSVLVEMSCEDDLENSLTPTNKSNTTDVIDEDDGESVFVEAPSGEDLGIGSNAAEKSNTHDIVEEDEGESTSVVIPEDNGRVPEAEISSAYLETFDPVSSFESQFELITNPFDPSEPGPSEESQINLAPEWFAIPIDPDYYEEVEDEPFWPEFNWSEFFEAN